jgi:hypothetical protein
MRLRTAVLSLVLMVVVGLGLTAASAYQRPDLSSAVFPATTIAPVRCIAAACTGTMVDLANYASAAAVITKGYHVQSATAARYAVLFDSAAGAAVAAVDSVLVDTSATSTTYTAQKIGYTGGKRWIRVLVRAGGTLDTMFLSATILRGGARFRN